MGGGVWPPRVGSSAWRFGGVGGGVDDLAPFVAEHHAVGLVGVAGEVEATKVVVTMATAAQHDEIGGVGGTTVGPVDDVVHLQAVAPAAQRVAALLVTVQDDPACALGHDAQTASDADRASLRDEHRAQRAVTRAQLGDRVRDGDAGDPCRPR
jgi:hypothetical protein